MTSEVCQALLCISTWIRCNLLGHGKEALEYLKIVLVIASCVVSVNVLVPVSLSSVMCVYSVMMYCLQFVSCVEMFTWESITVVLVKLLQ